MLNEAALKQNLLPREKIFFIALASASGVAILAHTFVHVPMAFTVPFVVMPSVAILIGIILLRRRLYDRLHLVASLLILGAWTGALATLAYDFIRPLLVLIFQFKFDPYGPIPIFGQLITGLPATTPQAIAAGWAYHFCNGLSFAMMFALFRPRGGMLAGFAWAMCLQLLMFVTYPHLLHVKLADPGFLTTGLAGHGLWGVVLGASIRKWGPYA